MESPYVLQGQVLWGSNNIFYVQVPEIGAGLIYECRVKGKKVLLEEKEYNPLAPGDFVEIEISSEASSGMILQRLPRQRVLHRWNRKQESRQTLAANLDLLLIVSSLVSPPFRPRFMDRCLALAELEEIPCLLIINKVDLGLNDEEERRLLDFSKMGYDVLLCSTVLGEGLTELKAKLSGKLSALIGQSGVGKSSLLRALDPKIDPKIGGLSLKFNRGNHTTTLAKTYSTDFAKGIIDTPGIRQLELPFMEARQLSYYFRDLRSFAAECGMNNCTHSHEPKCKVKEAVEMGLINFDRYESYGRILSGEDNNG